MRKHRKIRLSRETIAALESGGLQTARAGTLATSGQYGPACPSLWPNCSHGISP